MDRQTDGQTRHDRVRQTHRWTDGQTRHDRVRQTDKSIKSGDKFLRDSLFEEEEEDTCHILGLHLELQIM